MAMTSHFKTLHEDANGTPLKLSEGKPKVSLVPKFAVTELALVYEYGLKKYERDSWKKFTAEQAKDCLLDAGYRHLLEYLDGNEIDEASGLPHLVQVAWNCLTLHYHNTKGATHGI